jgi:hypothetical protein
MLIGESARDFRSLKRVRSASACPSMSAATFRHADAELAWFSASDDETDAFSQQRSLHRATSGRTCTQRNKHRVRRRDHFVDLATGTRVLAFISPASGPVLNWTVSSRESLVGSFGTRTEAPQKVPQAKPES